jgi:hypothetical protein
MDYNSLNNLLSSLEVKETESKILNEKNNTNQTQLDRDLNLNANSHMNLELANPQRMNNNNNTDSNKESMNEKINNYSFIKTKKYNEDLNINFKK